MSPKLLFTKVALHWPGDAQYPNTFLYNCLKCRHTLCQNNNFKESYIVKTHGEEIRIILLKGGHIYNCPAANGLKGLSHSDNRIYDRKTHMNQYACKHVCQRTQTHTSSQTHRPFKAVKCSLIRVAGRHPE